MRFRQTQELLKLVERERGNVVDNLRRYQMAQRAGNDMHGDVDISEAIAQHEERLSELEEIKDSLERS